MGFGGSSGNNEAAQARADEQARQEKIRLGTAEINKIFNGSTSGTGQLAAGAAYDPTKTYYLSDGSVWKPSGTARATGGAAAPGGSSMFGGAAPQAGASGSSGLFGGSTLKPGGVPVNADGSPRKTAGSMFPSNGLMSGVGYGGNYVDGNYIGGSTGSAAPGRLKTAAEEFADAVGNGLYSGTKTSGGFGDDFFKARRQAYIDYATPQLQQQHTDAQKQLTFALARGGNLNSSARSEKAGELQRLFDLNNQQIADQALSYETQSRNAVEDARANLISTLNATGDAEGAANSALARATALSQPAAYSPISNLFADFTSGLGIQAAQERTAAASGGSYTIPFNTGLFGGSGRVKTVG